MHLVILQNIFHAVVEVPRWTNAKMEVRLFARFYSLLHKPSPLHFIFH